MVKKRFFIGFNGILLASVQWIITAIFNQQQINGKLCFTF